MMGNMYCESGLRSDNVQDGMGYDDKTYTDAVNSGRITRDSFAHDTRGYGLCQWTFYTRKLELWNMTVGNGYSVADERLQCKLCITELQRDYSGLYGYLCSDCDLEAATRRICSEYERPAVNNYSPRINAACRYYDMFHDAEPDAPDDPPPEPDSDPADKDSGLAVDGECGPETWAALAKKMPIVKQGSSGKAVKALQCMLNFLGASLDEDGICGPLTKAEITEFQEGKL